MKSLVETDRLRLREFSERDLDELAALVADEDEIRFYPRTKTREQASAWIRRNLALYNERGFGFWFVASCSTSAFLGYCGIRPLALGGSSGNRDWVAHEEDALERSNRDRGCRGGSRPNV
jgi:RimJ/RimL family protein N-acetyltransferase